MLPMMTNYNLSVKNVWVNVNHIFQKKAFYGVHLDLNNSFKSELCSYTKRIVCLRNSKILGAWWSLLNPVRTCTN